MPQETFSCEALGRDMETVWRLGLTPFNDGSFLIVLMEGTKGIAYKLTKKEAHDLAVEILSKQGYTEFS